MQKVLFSLLLIGIVAAMAGAGTLAYFTDEETSTGNTFTAGTLDLELSPWSAYVQHSKDGTATGGTTFTIDNAAPGDSFDVYITLSNVGTLTGVWLDMHIYVTDSEPAADTEPEADAEAVVGNVYDLSSKITVAEFYFDGVDILPQLIAQYDANLDGELKLSELACHTVWMEVKYYDATLTTWELPGGTSTDIYIKLVLQWDTGNEYQGDQTTMDFEFVLYDEVANVR